MAKNVRRCTNNITYIIKKVHLKVTVRLMKKVKLYSSQREEPGTGKHRRVIYSDSTTGRNDLAPAVLSERLHKIVKGQNIS